MTLLHCIWSRDGLYQPGRPALFFRDFFAMKKSMLTAALMVPAALMLNACQEVSFDSNLNPQNFVEYAKPSRVEVYTNESILEHKYRSLGLVTGLACQEDPDDFIARESEARTDARIQAADMGANGIIFNKCIRLEKTQACYVSVTCYAEALQVANAKGEMPKRPAPVKAEEPAPVAAPDAAQQTPPAGAFIPSGESEPIGGPAAAYTAPAAKQASDAAQPARKAAQSAKNASSASAAPGQEAVQSAPPVQQERFIRRPAWDRTPVEPEPQPQRERFGRRIEKIEL